MIEDPIDRVEEPANEPGPDDEVHWISWDLTGGGYLAQCLGCGWHADERRGYQALAEVDGDKHLIDKELEADWDRRVAEDSRGDGWRGSPEGSPRLPNHLRRGPFESGPSPRDPMPALRRELDSGMTRWERVAGWSFLGCLAFTCIALGLSWPYWAQWTAFGVGWGIGALVGCRRHKVATDRARSRRVQALLDPYGGGHVSDIGRQWS